MLNLTKMVILLALMVSATGVRAQDDTNAEIDKLKKRLQQLEDRLATQPTTGGGGAGISDKLHIGGYGELHGNFTQGGSGDKFDIHRLVLYLGYDFSDWLSFHSETEIEHSYVKDDNGELVLEQAYLDMQLHPAFNIRAGRVLTPLGIINQTHEPTTFAGVERPDFAVNVIPTTWSSEGIGVFGQLAPGLSYQAYVVGGLDGSGFSATSGIRGGRIKERQSFNDTAITGRIDYEVKLGGQEVGTRKLRVGASTYFGGINNGESGKDPGVRGDIAIYAADMDFRFDRFYARAEIAHIFIEDARELGGGVADEIYGWYVETGLHVLPKAWAKGKLSAGDAFIFVRYEEYNTQHKVPSGVTPDPTADRNQWVFGLNFYPVSNLVFKVDYQFRNDDSKNNVDDMLNVGIGFTF